MKTFDNDKKKKKLVLFFSHFLFKEFFTTEWQVQKSKP